MPTTDASTLAALVATPTAGAAPGRPLPGADGPTFALHLERKQALAASACALATPGAVGGAAQACDAAIRASGAEAGADGPAAEVGDETAAAAGTEALHEFLAQLMPSARAAPRGEALARRDGSIALPSSATDTQPRASQDSFTDPAGRPEMAGVAAPASERRAGSGSPRPDTTLLLAQRGTPAPAGRRANAELSADPTPPSGHRVSPQRGLAARQAREAKTALGAEDSTPGVGQGAQRIEGDDAQAPTAALAARFDPHDAPQPNTSAAATTCTAIAVEPATAAAAPAGANDAPPANAAPPQAAATVAALGVAPRAAPDPSRLESPVTAASSQSRSAALGAAVAAQTGAASTRHGLAGERADAATLLVRPPDEIALAATAAERSELGPEAQRFGVDSPPLPAAASAPAPSAEPASAPPTALATMPPSSASPMLALDKPISVALPEPVGSAHFREALGIQVTLLARDGVQHAELHLNPAEMGPLSVQIALDGQQAQVHFGTDSALMRQIVESGLPALAAALREAGLTLSGGGVSQHAPGQRQGSKPASTLIGGRSRADADAEARVVRTVRAPLGRLDTYA